MHFYQHSYAQVLALPLKTFWFMNESIDRIQAQKDMRALTVANFGQATAESATQFRQHLLTEQGAVVKMKEEYPMQVPRDDVGFAELKRMAE